MKREFLALLGFTAILGACASKQYSYIKFDPDVLKMKVDSFQREDTALHITLTNLGGDTIVVPVQYIATQIDFHDSFIYRYKILSVNRLYPKSNYSKLNKKQQDYIISNLCRPYAAGPNYVFLGPGEKIKLVRKINDFYFTGFVRDKLYTGKLTLSVSEEMKMYCPRIWTGRMEDQFRFTL